MTYNTVVNCTPAPLNTMRQAGQLVLYCAVELGQSWVMGSITPWHAAKVGSNTRCTDNQPIPLLHRGVMVRVPEELKQPTNLKSFKGTKDPQEHLDTFMASMLYQGASDPIMCRALSTTLKNVVLRWLTTLSPKSIAY